LRLLQKTLAKDITIRVHSEEDYNNALAASDILFGKSTKADFEHLTEELLLDVLEGVPQFSIAANDLSAGLTANQILTEKTQVVSSKGEFKRALQENSLSINKEKLSDGEMIITQADLIKGKFLLVQRGKKNYYLIIAQ